ncbi:hypothetical protein GQ600_24261 [Phytophthora cactorum]|nr:hypothetical protein GQ600_24261 [Phytophthora cactorum]
MGPLLHSRRPFGRLIPYCDSSAPPERFVHTSRPRPTEWPKTQALHRRQRATDGQKGTILRRPQCGSNWSPSLRLLRDTRTRPGRVAGDPALPI